MSIRITNTPIPHTFAPRNYPCWICNAPAGQNCVLPNGNKREWCHDGRGPRHPVKEENDD